jgi:hypothetical protein
VDVSDVLAVDVGTTLLKWSRRVGRGPVTRGVVGATPRSLSEVVRSVQLLVTDCEPDLIGFASLRRATVVGDAIQLARDFDPAGKKIRASGRPGSRSADALAPMHRWIHQEGGPRGFDTLDAHLARRLTGTWAVAESMAWLSGLWDTHTAEWDAVAVQACGLQPAALPVVLQRAQVAGRFVLPVLGDHEATYRAVAARYGRIAVLECGTALAVLLPATTAHPDAVPGISSSERAGYREFIDPDFAVRLQGNPGRQLDWVGDEATRPDAATVLRTAVQLSGTTPVLLCGGYAGECAELLARSGPSDAIVVDTTMNPGAGVLDLCSNLDGTV